MPRLSPAEIEDLRSKLTADEDAIAFGEGTEPPHSHPLNIEKRAGEFRCKVCGTGLFKSGAKYESGSGWPSFYEALDPDAVETKWDFKLIAPRKEIHCGNCGAHLGHVFDDGPQPTGQRFCVNGTVLDFKPADGDN